MQKRITISILVGAACIFFTGCARISHQVNATVPVSMTSNAGREYSKVSEFDDSKKKVFFLWFLIPASTFDAGDMVEDHLGQSDGVVNLTIITSYDPLDWLVSFFTVGLVGTMDIDVHGDLIKFN